MYSVRWIHALGRVTSRLTWIRARLPAAPLQRMSVLTRSRNRRKGAASSEESIYDSPSLYELAFSFRDIESEVRWLRKAAAAEGGKFLELACGPALHAREMVRSGAASASVGVDLNPRMVEYATRKAEAEGLGDGRVSIRQGDMKADGWLGARMHPFLLPRGFLRMA